MKGRPSSICPPPTGDLPLSSRRLLPTFITVDELAQLLRVNRKTVYEALSRAEIPGARRIGGTYRISRDAVLRWFASGQDRVGRSRRNP
jgi:excisionase family DNA binding protein